MSFISRRKKTFLKMHKTALGQRPGRFYSTIRSGPRGKGGLLTMILPADGHKAFVRKLKNLRQKTVHRALRSIARECRHRGIKITHILTDNGSEFLDEKTISQIFGATVYYTYAYAGWEKGAIENLNRIIRFFYPRHTDFSKLSQRRIKALQWKLTNYPRPTKTRKVA